MSLRPILACCQAVFGREAVEDRSAVSFMVKDFFPICGTCVICQDVQSNVFEVVYQCISSIHLSKS